MPQEQPATQATQALSSFIGILFTILGVIFGLLIFAGICAVGAYCFLLWYKHRHREERSLDFVLLQVVVPRDNEIKIDAAEQMIASLYSVKHGGFLSFLKPQDHFSFEIVALPENILFYVSCPAHLRDLVEKQIHGAYPGAEVKEVDEYNIFSEEGKVAFAALKLRSANFYPIKVYKDLPTDPLSSLTSALAKMQPGEGAAIQILVSPAKNDWRALGKRYIAKQRQTEVQGEGKYVDVKALDAIEQKCAKPGFETTIRIVVSSSTKESAKMHVDNIKGAFEQFSSEWNSLKGAPIRFKKNFMIDFIYRYQPVWGKQSVLNSEELATIFHFPNKMVETPHIFWLNAKRAPAPAQIPTIGLHLGRSVYRGIERPIFISEDDRRRHTYVIGKTGTGKTELMKYLAMQDIKAGKGVAFVDPHGDAAEDLLNQIPAERAEDVIYFDPSDYERPVGLNMLEAYTEQQKHFVATHIIGLMYKLYDPHMTGIIGPRFEHAIRNAMLTVMSEAGSTFVEVVRCLTDSSFVQEILPKVDDAMVRRYWTDQIAQTADFHKSEVLDYIVSKFGRFVTNKLMRNIIGQSKSSFDLRRVMDEQKILIVNLSKGKMGEENSNFLGLVLVPKILVAAMSRQDVPEEKRPDFYLYVDEFQNFATETFADILSEARKFRLNLIVANQFIGQMEEEVKNAIFGNVGTLVAFRVGVNDASYLQHEFQPTFTESDLINIERFNAYVKTIVENEPVPPFSLDTTRDLSQVARNYKVGEMIRQLSRLRYGRDRELVEAEVAQRARL
jgi:hypothetical protein